MIDIEKLSEQDLLKINSEINNLELPEMPKLRLDITNSLGLPKGIEYRDLKETTDEAVEEAQKKDPVISFAIHSCTNIEVWGLSAPAEALVINTIRQYLIDNDFCSFRNE